MKARGMSAARSAKGAQQPAKRKPGKPAARAEARRGLSARPDLAPDRPGIDTRPLPDSIRCKGKAVPGQSPGNRAGGTSSGRLVRT
jgi:hypothetical protein